MRAKVASIVNIVPLTQWNGNTTKKNRLFFENEKILYPGVLRAILQPFKMPQPQHHIHIWTKESLGNFQQKNRWIPKLYRPKIILFINHSSQEKKQSLIALELRKIFTKNPKCQLTLKPTLVTDGRKYSNFRSRENK